MRKEQKRNRGNSGVTVLDKLEVINTKQIWKCLHKFGKSVKTGQKILTTWSRILLENQQSLS
jgi:hypothetical protein